MPVHENTAPKLSLTCWALFPWSRVSRGFPLAAPALSLTLLSVLVGFCEAALRALTVVCGGVAGAAWVLLRVSSLLPGKSCPSHGSGKLPVCWGLTLVVGQRFPPQLSRPALDAAGGEH
jgi:hypothetical protein